MWLLAVLGATAALVAPAASGRVDGSWLGSDRPNSGAQPLCFTDQPGQCFRVCTLFVAESRGPGSCPQQEVRGAFHFIGRARQVRPRAERHPRRVPASRAATAP
jgi:hypothetical protein